MCAVYTHILIGHYSTYDLRVKALFLGKSGVAASQPVAKVRDRDAVTKLVLEWKAGNGADDALSSRPPTSRLPKTRGAR